MPKHHSRIRAKRSKIQLANESLAALQQEVDVDRVSGTEIHLSTIQNGEHQLFPDRGNHG